jgi:two-component system CheB/CheR fusion protein
VDARITALQMELYDKDEYIQNSNEELESTNEELKSSNEEMQSVNEELQSTNEELETAKEELQSVNEELSTVNAELQQRVLDLSRANNDLNNLMASTGVGTIFVNHKLLIQRFTASVTPIINLIASDVGRPLGDIASNLTGYDQLLDDVRAVLESLIPRDVEVQTRAGSWYLLRIQPYRTMENVIEGAVINFTEISELKKAQEARQETEGLRRLATVVLDAHDAILVQDLTGRILAWNPGAARMYGWSEAEALALNIRDLVPETQRKEALATVRQLSRGQVLEPYRIPRITKNGQTVEVWLTATALVDGDGEMYAIATTERVTS